MLSLRIIADTAVDDHARPTTSLEVGQHHLAEDAAGQVTTCVDYHDIAGLRMVEHMPVELALGIRVFVDAIEILPFRHKLEREGRAGNCFAGCPGNRSPDERVANAQAAELTTRRRAADLRQSVD